MPVRLRRGDQIGPRHPGEQRTAKISDDKKTAQQRIQQIIEHMSPHKSVCMVGHKFSVGDIEAFVDGHVGCAINGGSPEPALSDRPVGEYPVYGYKESDRTDGIEPGSDSIQLQGSGELLSTRCKHQRYHEAPQGRYHHRQAQETVENRFFPGQHKCHVVAEHGHASERIGIDTEQTKQSVYLGVVVDTGDDGYGQ